MRGDFQDWATAHSLLCWQCLGTVMAPLGVSLSLLFEDQSLIKVDLSAMLTPLDSSWFMLCSWAVSFFQNLCPASFPPVTETRPERFKNRQNSSLYLVRYRIKLSHYQACICVCVCVCVCVFFWMHQQFMVHSRYFQSTIRCEPVDMEGWHYFIQGPGTSQVFGIYGGMGIPVFKTPDTEGPLYYYFSWWLCTVPALPHLLF